MTFCPSFAWAYENTTTHRAITSEAVKFFNSFYPDEKLTDAERLSVVKGSSDEDMPPRWLNHFYDPIHNAGLRGMMSSKTWAQNTNAQSLRLAGGIVGNYFDVPTDYSWDRAVYDYAWGDKNRGLEALGHTLHLIQDATVPDHTRDDIHVFKKTYEAYANQFNLDNLELSNKLISGGGQPIISTDLNSAFDKMADYSNGNFFSDDTILAYYDLPKVISEKTQKLRDNIRYIFGYSKDQKLVLIKNVINSGGELSKIYSLKDPDDSVMSAYWSPLSEKALEGSAGVVKLFFDAVAQEKIDHKLRDKNKSFLDKLLDGLAGKTGNLLASVGLFSGQNGSSVSTTTQASSTLPTDNLLGLVAPDGPTDLVENPPKQDLSIAELQQILTDLQEKLARLKERLGIDDSPSGVSDDLAQNLNQAK
ncbi:MAG: hypothetical protein NTV48_00405, partial [Candidatus Vogelbacteria bacterium]|nr:hypothetical protein [Candidatus Vogelbacteria bacterium]